MINCENHEDSPIHPSADFFISIRRWGNRAAAGYLLKDAPRRELIAAVIGTASGKSHVDPNVAGKLLTHLALTATMAESSIADALNERERAILKLLAHGLSNADIAQRLYLSEGTVKNYVSSIFDKLGVSDRTQAAILAICAGLVTPRGDYSLIHIVREV